MVPEADFSSYYGRPVPFQGADQGIGDDQGEDRGPHGRSRRPVRRSRRRLRLAGRGGGQRHVGVVCLQEAAALQGKQQREGGPDDHHGDDEQDNDRDQGGMRGARLAQGHRGAGQQHRVLGHAPAPDDGGDAGRGQDPDAAK